MSEFDIKAAATAVLLVFAFGLTWVGRRLDRKDPGFDNGLIVLSLLLVLWIPREYRDLGLSVIAGLLGLLNGVIVALLCGAATFALASVVPGGGTVVLLALAALLAYAIAREERTRLRDVERAKMLVPGEQGQEVVAVIGACAGTARRPDNGEEVAAWWAEARVASAPLDEATRTSSDGTIEIASPQGPVVVVLGDVTFDRTRVGNLALEGDEARALAAVLGVASDTEPVVAELTWIEQGTSLFVRGVPSWEADRAGSGYRGTAFVPVFRHSESSPLTITVGTLLDIRQRIKYEAVMWLAWSAPCVAIAGLQVGLWF